MAALNGGYRAWLVREIKRCKFPVAVDKITLEMLLCFVKFPKHWNTDIKTELNLVTS